MRSTKKVSVWPVAFVGGLMYERPICKDGKVIDWFYQWNKNKRPFPLDMAGFAVNLQHLLAHPSASFSLMLRVGQQESHFLSRLVNHRDLEARGGDNCTKIYVWHTKTRQVDLTQENINVIYDKSVLSQI
jgi:hypothetical protein